MSYALLMDIVFLGGSMGIIGLLVLVLDIVAIVSLLGGSASVEHKLLWTVVILLLPVLGMLLYFLLGRSSRDA
jgi:hypothetical protein